MPAPGGCGFRDSADPDKVAEVPDHIHQHPALGCGLARVLDSALQAWAFEHQLTPPAHRWRRCKAREYPAPAQQRHHPQVLHVQRDLSAISQFDLHACLTFHPQDPTR